VKAKTTLIKGGWSLWEPSNCISSLNLIIIYSIIRYESYHLLICDLYLFLESKRII